MFNNTTQRYKSHWWIHEQIIITCSEYKEMFHKSKKIVCKIKMTCDRIYLLGLRPLLKVRILARYQNICSTHRQEGRNEERKKKEKQAKEMKIK